MGEYRKLENGALVHVPGHSADFGADSAHINSYLEEDFALGTATKPLCGGGQTDLFHAMWRLRAPAKEWGDLRAVFTRYLINESQPEDASSGGLLYQHGNGMAIQDDRRALALYHPNGYLHEGIHSLRLALIMQELTSPVEEVWIGDRLLPGGDGEAQEADWVLVKDGPMLLAFYPLCGTNLGREAAIRCRQENGYRVLSFYNFQGSARDFPQHELQIIQNGFIFEAATAADYPDVPAFLADLRKAQVSDTTVLESRRARYLREGRELFLWMDPALQTIKAAVVNGEEIAYPRLEVTGLDPTQLPWLGQPKVWHDSLDWWERIAARGGIKGMEGLSGKFVD
jgi:hypothetical protein